MHHDRNDGKFLFQERIINQEVKSTSPFCVAIDNQGGWDYEESDVLTTETIDQIIQNRAGVNSWPNMDYVSICCRWMIDFEL